MKQNPSWFARLKNRLQYEFSQAVTRTIDVCAAVRTEFCKTPETTQFNPEVLVHAKRYQPSSYYLALRSLKWCHRRFSKHAIMDLGCGAGRVLVVAAWVGYADIYGLELDEQLSRQANDNLSRFLKRFRLRRSISVIHSSVTEYRMENKAWVVYLYNPFGEVILKKFLENNQSAILNHDCLFVYINPIHEQCLTALGYRTIHSWELKDFSQTTRVYRHEKYC